MARGRDGTELKQASSKTYLLCDSERSDAQSRSPQAAKIERKR